MSEMPQNPLWDAMQNWNRIATEMIANWRSRLENVRGQWYGRFYGPSGNGGAQRVGPLRRMMATRRAGARTPRRTRTSRRAQRTPVRRGRVIPHASKPGYEKYDFTYRKGAMQTPPFSTHKRLGMEGETYDFSY
jgi:hypothetical protein